MAIDCYLEICPAVTSFSPKVSAMDALARIVAERIRTTKFLSPSAAETNVRHRLRVDASCVTNLSHDRQADMHMGQSLSQAALFFSVYSGLSSSNSM